MELGHGIEEKYLNLQQAPPLSLFIFSLPGVADSSQILLDSKEIQKVQKQLKIKTQNNANASAACEPAEQTNNQCDNLLDSLVSSL